METNVTVKKNVIGKLREMFKVRVCFADGGSTDPQGGSGDTTDPQAGATTTTTTTPQVNYEQLIANARQEEKNKLYPEIEKLKGENKKLVDSNNNLLIQLGTKDSKITELEGQLADAKKNATESVKVKALEDEIAKLKGELVNKDAVLEQEKSRIELEYYTKSKITEANGAIIPELVSGSTKEEIDASVEQSVARFNQIAGVAQQTTTTQTTKPNSNQIPVADPANANTQMGQYSMEDLMSLDMTKPENVKKFAEMKKKMGI